MKTVLIAALIAISGQVHSSEIICSGKKHFSSPYPGAGSSVRAVLRVNSKLDQASLTLSGQSGGAKVQKIDLSRVDHQRDSDRFIIEGRDQDGKFFKTTINYLTPEGVTASIKHTKNTSLTYECSRFSVKQ